MSSIIYHVTKVSRYVTWGGLYSEVQTWSNFSKTPFQFSSFSTSMFSWVTNDTVWTIGWQFYCGLCRINTFLLPAQQNHFFSQKIRFFLKVGASALQQKKNIAIFKLVVFYLVVNTMLCFWKLFVTTKGFLIMIKSTGCEFTPVASVTFV